MNFQIALMQDRCVAGEKSWTVMSSIVKRREGLIRNLSVRSRRHSGFIQSMKYEIVVLSDLGYGFGYLLPCPVVDGNGLVQASFDGLP